MGAFFTTILQRIAEFANFIINLVKAVFNAAYAMFIDLASFVFDSVLSIAITALMTIDLSAILQFTGLWNQIPANVIEVLSAVGLGSAFTIIASAIVTRLILQLIPFTRLGS